MKEQMLQRITGLPDIIMTDYWCEVNQAGNPEYHLIIVQRTDTADLIFMKHYRHIGYDNPPCREAMAYNESMIDGRELLVLMAALGVPR